MNNPIDKVIQVENEAKCIVDEAKLRLKNTKREISQKTEVLRDEILLEAENEVRSLYEEANVEVKTQTAPILIDIENTVSKIREISEEKFNSAVNLVVERMFKPWQS